MRPTSPLPLLILLAAACSSPENLGLARPDVQNLANGAVHVFNPGPSSWSDTLGWKLVLERTITPPANGPGQLVHPLGIGVTADSSVVVNDATGDGILVFAADGRFLRQIGRHGTGPGEYGEFFDIDVRGDVIAVHECNAMRAILFRTDGTVVSQWLTQHDCAGAARPVLDADGEVLLSRYIRVNDESLPVAVRWSSSGIPIDTVPLPRTGPAPPGWEAGGGMHTIPFTAWALHQLTDDAIVWIGMSADYRLLQVSGGVDTLLIVEVAASRPTIPDSIRQAALVPYASNARLKDIAKLEDIPTQQPFFSGLSIDEHNQLWIHRVGATGETVSFDVINDEGFYLGSVPAPPGSSRLGVWRHDRMYRLAENAAGVPVIEVYRVDRNID